LGRGSTRDRAKEQVLNFYEYIYLNNHILKELLAGGDPQYAVTFLNNAKLYL
jgi:hypothetical protein